MAITAQMTTDVTQLYVALFLRAPDSAGLGDWVVQLNALVELGSTYEAAVATVAQRMYDTPDARPYYPSFWTNEQIVTEFYIKVLGRKPDAEGKAGWLAALNAPGATKGVVISQLIAAVNSWVPGTDAAINAQGTMSKALFLNKVAVAEYYAATMMGGVGGATAAISAVTATSDVSSTAAIEALIATGGGVTSAGQTFSLTANADVIPGLLGSAGTTSNAGDNSIYSTETTLSSGDNLNGGAGNDTLYYASSTSLAAVNESGFTTSSIENAVVTSDVPGFATTFDTTGMTGLARITNDNSAQNLTFVGGTALLGLSLTNVGAATRATSIADTTVTYNAATVAGTADKQALTLSNNKNVDGTAIGTVTVNGIEEFNVTTSVGASLLDGIASTTMKKMTVVGDQSLTLAKTVGVGGINFTDNAAVNVLDASGLTGTAALDVTIGANTATLDVAVTGGAGNDRADFSTNFDAKDAFTGGAGRDTLALRQDIATGQTATTGGTVATVEILEITNGGTGTTNMNNFPGVDTVFYSGLTGGVALAAASTITNAVTGLTVQVNVDAVGQDSTTTLKTNGTTDAINYVFNMVGAADNMGTVSAAEFETVNITTGDDTTVLGTGVLTIANLTETVATKLTIAGNAALTIAASTNPTTAVLATIDASAATAAVTISGTNLYASGGTTGTGSTVTLGSGNDTFNVATANGSDTFDLSKGGNDKIVYNALAQSDPDMDVIKSFTTGDVVDVRALLGGVGVASSIQFVGTKASFGEAQGALLAGGTTSAVFDASTSILWVDNGLLLGTLDSNDFRVKLDGVTTVVAADLGFTTGVTFTANQAAFNTATAAHSTENNAVGTENDTINATVAQLVGSTVNGLGGTDVLNLSATAAAGEIADLVTPTFTNVETVNLASTVEGVSFDAADLGVGQVTKVNGISGSNQSITLNNASDISAVTLTNLPVLNIVGAVTMTTAQHNAFTVINAAGGVDGITLTTAGTSTLDADVEAYQSDITVANLAYTWTLGADAQSVVEGSNSDITLNINGRAITGTFIGLGIDDTIVSTTGANVSAAQPGGVAGASFGTNLTQTGTLTQTAAQFAGWNTLTAAGAADTAAITTAYVGATRAGIETYTLNVNGTAGIENHLTLNHSAAVNAGADDDAVTVNGIVLGAVAINGQGNGGDANALGDNNDTIALATGSNISAATISNFEFWGIADGATVTMTAAQWAAMNNASTAAAAFDASGTETVTISDAIAAGTDAGNLAIDIENVVLAAAGVDAFTRTDVTTIAGTINIVAGGADVITLVNNAITAVSNPVVITGFTADDKLMSTLATLATVSLHVAFEEVTATDGNVAAAASSVLELNTNVYQVLDPTLVGDDLAVEAGLINAIGTIGNGDYTVVAYGNGNAYIYQMNMTDSNANGNLDLAAEMTIELIGQINGVVANSLDGINFN
jgi:hypothetical protein